ncbi:hypothetical protein KJ766_00315 [Patescibacteria group bacterium]|nr:hypothetical protein [Patescibacteria group bacterium]MBU1718899.1 hypothetical protein [Bacteroidota bacterium]
MKKTIALLIAVAVVATSCQKQPVASFSTDKDSYTAGETVKLTNNSIDAKSYLWTFPDGQTSVSKSVDYTLNANDAGGTKVFKLEAFSKNGKKTDEATKSITVVAARGDVTFWQHSSGGYAVTVVTISGVSQSITSDFTAAPDCGASGAANFNGPPGNYSYTAVENGGGATWSGTVTITANSCLTMQLY